METTPLFKTHPRTWQQNRYVYPVISRRSNGLSIGINLNPDKACNFDCVYCSVDRKTPSKVKTVDLEKLRVELDNLLGLALSGEIWQLEPFINTPKKLQRLNDVAFSGDGEPTSFPLLEKACRMADELIRWHQASAKIIIITNATLLNRSVALDTSAFLDHIPHQWWCKLDAGTEPYYQMIERTKIPLQVVLENILLHGKRRPIVIQSLFLNYRGASPSPEEITAYCMRLKHLRTSGCQIDYVQVYTVARNTADAAAKPLTNAEVDAIAAQVRALGIRAETYYSPT
jgi:wyosine [tRNA(Phe)-imidazoG37] synthetase (radical SAM superfamily)